MSSSMGRMTSHLWWKIEFMIETTNQIKYNITSIFHEYSMNYSPFIPTMLLLLMLKSTMKIIKCHYDNLITLNTRKFHKKIPHPPFRMRSPQRWAAPRSSLSTSTAAAPGTTGGLVVSPAPKKTAGTGGVRWEKWEKWWISIAKTSGFGVETWKNQWIVIIYFTWKMQVSSLFQPEFHPPQKWKSNRNVQWFP